MKYAGVHIRCTELCRRIRENAENRDFRLVRAPATSTTLAQNSTFVCDEVGFRVLDIRLTPKSVKYGWLCHPYLRYQRTPRALPNFGDGRQLLSIGLQGQEGGHRRSTGSHRRLSISRTSFRDDMNKKRSLFKAPFFHGISYDYGTPSESYRCAFGTGGGNTGYSCIPQQMLLVRQCTLCYPTCAWRL